MEYSDDSMGGGNTLPQKVAAATPAAPDQLIGTVLEGRYAIEDKIGFGGFGSVYRATDQKMMARKIVVKVMHADRVTNDWNKKKFQQEIEALARIDHPGIVGALDSGETQDGRPYIVMQFVDGVSLRSLLTPDGLPFWRVANIIRQSAKALSAAHKAGILHRDLKPENIMIQIGEDEEYVKVIDFGIAKVRNSIVDVTTAKDISVGTIAYMSPEQLSAKPLSAESDVYALAVIAYEMLTGKRPTNPESAFQLLEMQRSGIRVKPSDLRTGLTAEAESILLKALSFEPQERYGRARDFGDLLAAALLGDDEQTRLASPRRRTVAQGENSLETAHVLFFDVVGYSRLLIDEQSKQLKQLQQFVSATAEWQRAKATDELISLPTGDGMALVFFNDPQAPVQCAVELSQQLQKTPEIQVRMGVHSGLVYRMADIKNNMNVAGGGINIAQRVMDCGDNGHILLSKRVADDLGQLARWSPYLHDLGSVEVKHRSLVHIFSLYGEGFGNPERPAKLKEPDRKRPNTIRNIGIAAGILGAILIAASILWYRNSQRSVSTPSTATVDTTIPSVPERYITYWVTYQKMRNGKPDSEPRQSAGNDIFGNGWKFQFNLMPNEPGALYLLNVGPGQDQKQEYNILFPLPGVGRSNPNLAAKQTFNSDWARFVEKTGVERVWIIWSTQPIAALDDIFSRAVSTKGVIIKAEDIAQVQGYLNAKNSQASFDKEKKQTVVKGRGEVLVGLVELTHEAN